MPRPPFMSVPEVGRHLGGLVRQGRLLQYKTVESVASNARVSIATVKRIEAGSLSVSLGAWLSVMEATLLLQKVAALRDPIAQAVLEGTGVRRGRPGC